VGIEKEQEHAPTSNIIGIDIPDPSLDLSEPVSLEPPATASLAGRSDLDYGVEPGPQSSFEERFEAVGAPSPGQEQASLAASLEPALSAYFEDPGSPAALASPIEIAAAPEVEPGQVSTEKADREATQEQDMPSSPTSVPTQSFTQAQAPQAPQAPPPSTYDPTVFDPGFLGPVGPPAGPPQGPPADVQTAEQTTEPSQEDQPIEVGLPTIDVSTYVTGSQQADIEREGQEREQAYQDLQEQESDPFGGSPKGGGGIFTSQRDVAQKSSPVLDQTGNQPDMSPPAPPAPPVFPHPQPPQWDPRINPLPPPDFARNPNPATMSGRIPYAPYQPIQGPQSQPPVDYAGQDAQRDAVVRAILMQQRGYA